MFTLSGCRNVVLFLFQRMKRQRPMSERWKRKVDREVTGPCTPESIEDPQTQAYRTLWSDKTRSYPQDNHFMSALQAPTTASLKSIRHRPSRAVVLGNHCKLDLILCHEGVIRSAK